MLRAGAMVSTAMQAAACPQLAKAYPKPPPPVKLVPHVPEYTARIYHKDFFTPRRPAPRPPLPPVCPPPPPVHPARPSVPVAPLDPPLPPPAVLNPPAVLDPPAVLAPPRRDSGVFMPILPVPPRYRYLGGRLVPAGWVTDKGEADKLAKKKMEDN